MPFLKALEGRGVQINGFEGGLDVEYWTGDGETAIVRLYNGVEEGIKPLWNTYLLIPGTNERELVCVCALHWPA